MPEPLHSQTPLWKSETLGRQLSSQVYLKMEAFQPVGSFKLRGMGAACQAASLRGVDQVFSSSGGNAGYTVAYAGRQLGLAVTIVVPETTSDRARELIEAEEASLIIHGASWDDAHSHATRLAEEKKGAYIHPFDDPVIWGGHASLVPEIAREISKPGMVVVSVGGGGLLAGLVQGLHDVGWQDVPVIAVETYGTNSFARSVSAGYLVTLEKIDSIAVTLGARKVCQQALDWTHRHDIIPWQVSDRAAVDACLRFADEHRVLVEPACGAALAVGYSPIPPIEGHEQVVFIVCGGAGVNRTALAKWDTELGDPSGEGSEPSPGIDGSGR